MVYEGVSVDELSLRLWQELRRVSIYDLAGRTPEGAFRGELNFIYPSQPRDPLRTHIAVQAALPPDTLNKIFQADLDEYIDGFAFPGERPTIAIEGYADEFREVSQTRAYLDISVDQAAPFTYRSIPAQAMSFGIRLDPAVVAINEIELQALGGIASGRVMVERTDAQPARIEVTARDFDFDATLSGAQALMIERNGGSPGGTEAARRATGARLDMDLTLAGPLHTFGEMSGNAQLDLYDGNLADLRLIGGLSTLLENAGLGFTTLRLEEASADLRLRDNSIRIASGNIQGPAVNVEPRGR